MLQVEKEFVSVPYEVQSGRDYKDQNRKNILKAKKQQ